MNTKDFHNSLMSFQSSFPQNKKNIRSSKSQFEQKLLNSQKYSSKVDKNLIMKVIQALKESSQAKIIFET